MAASCRLEAVYGVRGVGSQPPLNRVILVRMTQLFDSFWRAVMYCLHPRVIALSVLPVIVMAGMSLGLAYFFWDSALAVAKNSLDAYSLVSTMIQWLESLGLSNLQSVLAPMLVLMLAIPVIAIITLFLVAIFMTPVMVKLVADRRFPELERKRGGSFLSSLLWSLGSTVLAAIALIISVPLWLIPPLVLVLPPLIWGWLTYRVMSYDALAVHASREERQHIFKAHRLQLLTIGLVGGYLGAAPSLLWASGAVFIALAPILVPVAVWVYTLVFAFASLWFAHYALAALAQLRKQKSAETVVIRAQDAIDVIATSVSAQAPPALPPVSPRL